MKDYNLLPTEFIDKLYDNEYSGYPENVILQIEKRIGRQLPPYLREYCLKYATLAISNSMDEISEPDRFEFTFNWLEAEKEDWEEEYEMTVEEIKEQTNNYLVFWSENQGCWTAGILEEDLDKENPPVYMNEEEMFGEWEKANNNFDSFLFWVLWNNIRYCDDFEVDNSRDTGQILKQIEENGIDKTNLTPTYTNYMTNCWDEEKKKLYLFAYNKEGVLVQMSTVSKK